MLNLAVFASGNGSTMQAIIDAISENRLDAKINIVVSNNPDAFALTRAKDAGIESYILEGKNLSSRDDEIFNLLSKYDVDMIVLAGYLKMIGPKVLEKYTVINTHPSLLPKFGGKGMHGMKVHTAVVEAGEKISGVTLHYVNGEYDKGDIIAQATVEVLPTDTPDDVSTKVQKVEKIQLVNELQKFASKK